jgi:hypothetical protein
MSGESSTSATPHSRATRSRRSPASPVPSALSLWTTAARRTGSRDGCGDPAVDVVGKARLLSLNEVEDELPVSLRPG